MWRYVRRALVFCVLALSLCAQGAPPSCGVPRLSLDEIETLRVSCAPRIGSATLAALVHNESSACPLAIGINHRGVSLSRPPVDEGEAINVTQRLIRRGYNVDVGPVQVNIANLAMLRRHGITLDQLFDSCTNLRAGQIIFLECYDRAVRKFGETQAAVHATASCYNTGTMDGGIRNGYVRRLVLAAARFRARSPSPTATSQ